MSDKRKYTRKKREHPEPEDIYAGKRLRELRIMRRVTQTALAEQVDVSFQQLQKYERAANRMSVSMICQLARVLDTHPSYFFKEDGGINPPLYVLDSQSRRWMELFQSLPDSRTQKAVLGMFEEIVRFVQPPAWTFDKPSE